MYSNEPRPDRRTSIADTFQYNPQMEAIERLQQTHPDQYDATSPTVKMSFGSYKTARAAAKELGRDISGKESI
ncbi:hypothetical protein ACH470_15505 [Streptomyces bottropensis]|uniref:hypothetical protein n=1 Tax=Streptomyces bottropensis TaxID=42235 RepID=UPI0037B5B6EE